MTVFLAKEFEHMSEARTDNDTSPYPARILDAAAMEFGNHGFDGARMQSIADRAGCDKKLIHHYFGNKDAVYRAVVERDFQQLDECIGRIDGDDDPLVGLESFVETYIGFMHHHEAHVLLVLQQELSRDEVGRSLGRRARASVRDYLISQLSEGKHRGLVRRDLDDELAIVTILGACMHGFALSGSLSDLVSVSVRSEDAFVSYVDHVKRFVRAAVATQGDRYGVPGRAVGQRHLTDHG